MEFKRLCLLMLTLAPVCQAAYDSEDAFKLNAELAYRYDDNVFRLADQQNNAVTSQNGKKGDSNLLASVGARYDLPISRQTFYVQGAVSRQTYFDFSQLSHTAWSADLGWNWQAGSHWSGSLTTNAGESMSSFDDTRSDVKDIVKQSGLNWTGAWTLTSNWQLVANAGLNKQDHNVRQFEDAKRFTYGVGLRYVTDKGSSLTLRQQWQEYDYLNDLGVLVADLRGYKDQSFSVDAIWPVTEKLNLQASGGISRWKPNSGGQSSKSTPQADLSVVWSVTGKSKLRAGIGQNFDQFNSGAGRDLERTIFAGANWEVSEKVRWDAEYRHRQKETKAVNNLTLRDEKYDSVSINLIYQIYRSISIKPYARFEQRNDQIGKADYKNTQFGLSGRYDF